MWATPHLKPLTSSSGLRHAVLTVPHDALLDGSNTICNDIEKIASHICAITKKDICMYACMYIHIMC